jgi:colanic acid/amylovoran biosynthesis glycosyltransferase
LEKVDLAIFSYNFPYGTGETFLDHELPILSSVFNKIHLFPLFYGNNRTPRELPLNVSFSEPFIRFDIKKDKLKLIFWGIVNLSPVSFSISEFREKKVFKKWLWITNWLSTTLIIRILLKGKNFHLILEKTKPKSVFYFYWGDKSSGIVPFLRNKINNPIVARFHNSDLYEEIKGGYIPYRKKLLKNLNTAIFISEMGRNYMVDKYSEINFNSIVFRLGTRANHFSAKSKDGIFRIVSCSYVVPIKRVQLILEALQMLPFKTLWTHLGDGPLLPEIKKKINSGGSQLEGFFPGHLKNEEILKFYSENPVDLFINVSKSEGIPVSVMEAISFGIPILATNVGGTSEIVNETLGILISKEITAELIAKKITDFYFLDENRKMEMRKAAYHHWETNYNAATNYELFAGFLKTLSQTC